MLILSRKLNESIVIDGNVIVKVLRVDGDVVKLGIQAPSNVPVHRQEVYEEIQKSNQEALTRGRPKLPKMMPLAKSQATEDTTSNGTAKNSPANSASMAFSSHAGQKENPNQRGAGPIQAGTATEKQPSTTNT